MATAVVSGRVDEQVKARAEAFIRAAGLSAGDVIRMVWERIAQTGEIPDAGDGAGWPDAAHDPLERLGELRASFGACEDLVSLDDDQMRDMIASRYA
ncbi:MULTISPECIES: type II toxin-antitoxin system RelB/DinJ family antitoxin [Enorma]|uniref:type II toxin-antitoxin system RelB/DinJ family antitoxin n=1 Tax=Enorma TaxID=1472762 RepID=UPI00034DBF16|nr:MULTISPECIES: type II toxin-antitoxin system RelB/DinJ family antitoxin [Enorma]